MFLDLFRKRLPESSEFYTVLGISVFVVHSWSMWGFIHEVPSFILYFKTSQIFAIFSYMMGFALLESLMVAFGLGLISFLLPARWFKNGFIYNSFITIVLGAITMLWFENRILTFNNTFPPKQELFVYVATVFSLWVALLLLFYFFKPMQKIVLFISDRIGVMSYLYVPLGVLGLIVVLVRNLW